MLNCANQLKLLKRNEIGRDAVALDEDLSMAQKLTQKEIEVYAKHCDILLLSCGIQDKNERVGKEKEKKWAKKDSSSDNTSVYKRGQMDGSSVKTNYAPSKFVRTDELYADSSS